MRIVWRSQIRPLSYAVILGVTSLALPALMGSATRGYNWFTGQRAVAKVVTEMDWMLDSGLYRDALQNANVALQFGADPASILARRSMAHLKLGENQQAVADASRVLTLDSGNGLAYQLRAEARLNLMQRPPAIEDLGKAVILTPTWAKGYMLRGQAYRDEGRLDKSLEDLDKAVDLQASAEHYYQRSQTHSVLRNFQEAEADLNRAIGIEPTRAELFDARAQVREAQGDAKGAAADRQQAVRWGSPIASIVRF